MGRIFETRKATMFKRWDRMAKAFTRCGKEIAIAVKAGGPEPEHNPQLRRALQNARSVNMPKDKIQNAIDKAMGVGSEDYEIIHYEAYAPHGIALVIETATDNPTRTVANIRLHLKKEGGNLGTSGSVMFNFERLGVFHLDPESVEERDDLELEMIDHGLVEMGMGQNDDGDRVLVLHCEFNDFGQLQSGLEEYGIEPKTSTDEFVPNDVIDLPDEQVEEVMKLIERLENDDDVQRVFHNLA